MRRLPASDGIRRSKSAFPIHTHFPEEDMRLFPIAAVFALFATAALADEVSATTVHLKFGGVS